MVRGGGGEGGGGGGGGNPRCGGDHKDHRSGWASGGNQRLGSRETIEDVWRESEGSVVLCCAVLMVVSESFYLVLHCGLGLPVAAAVFFVGCPFPIFLPFFFEFSFFFSEQ